MVMVWYGGDSNVVMVHVWRMVYGGDSNGVRDKNGRQLMACCSVRVAVAGSGSSSVAQRVISKHDKWCEPWGVLVAPRLNQCNNRSGTIYVVGPS